MGSWIGGSVAGLILAAGAGRRFTGLKQVAPFRNRPLIEHSVSAMTEVFGRRTLVILGSQADRIREQADLGPAEVVICPHWAGGQAESLKCGIEAAAAEFPGLDGVAIVLGDQPLIEAEAIRRVCSAAESGAELVRATYRGRPGHPVFLGAKALERALELRGDVGAREVAAEFGFETVACDGLGTDADADTPEALIALEGRR